MEKLHVYIKNYRYWHKIEHVLNALHMKPAH